MKELLPCPFCGNTEIELINTGLRFFVGCYSKSCDKMFDEGLETGYYKSKQLAIKAWNKRVKIWR